MQKRVNIVFCLAVIAAGGVYLAVGKSALPFVMPFITACFAALTTLTFSEARRKGAGFARYIPAICLAILTAGVAVAAFLCILRGV